VQGRLLVGRLGVRHLRLVVGPSFGGVQALQWALDHPDRVDAIGGCWNDGHPASLEAMIPATVRLRVKTMRLCGAQARPTPHALHRDAHRLRPHELRRRHGTQSVRAGSDFRNPRRASRSTLASSTARKGGCK
jgi:hypothetical protein